MGIELDLSKKILAPPSVVWSLLGSIQSWPRWWRDCEAARVKDGRAPREGSELELVIKPGATSGNYHPTIDLYTEDRVLGMTYRGAFSQSTCEWYLNRKPDGTEVRAKLVYDGVGSLFIRLTGRTTLVRLALENQLKDLKKFAERMT